MLSEGILKGERSSESSLQKRRRTRFPGAGRAVRACPCRLPSLREERFSFPRYFRSCDSPTQIKVTERSTSSLPRSLAAASIAFAVSGRSLNSSPQANNSADDGLDMTQTFSSQRQEKKACLHDDVRQVVLSRLEFGLLKFTMKSENNASGRSADRESEVKENTIPHSTSELPTTALRPPSYLIDDCWNFVSLSILVKSEESRLGHT